MLAFGNWCEIKFHVVNCKILSCFAFVGIAGTYWHSSHQAEVGLFLPRQSPTRVLKMMIYGFFVNGPLNHFLNTALNHSLKNKKSWIWNLVRLLLVNVIVLPCITFCNLVALNSFSGVKLQKSIENARDRLLQVMKTTWSVMPAIQISTRNVHPDRLVYMYALIGLVFGTIGNIKHKKGAK
jgi:hypothetical protein